MRIMVREEARVLAYRVADELVAKLKAGKLAKIGIEEIAAACDAACPVPLNELSREQLLNLATRRVVSTATSS